MKSRKAMFFPVLVLSLLSSGLFVQTQSRPNLSGTWKMNADKSKFAPGGPKAIIIKLDSTFSERSLCQAMGRQ